MKSMKRIILLGVAVMVLMSFAAPAMAQTKGGGFDSLFVDAARGWGDNSCGQLGDGTTTQRNTSVAVKNLSGVKAIAASECLSLVLKTDGTVWTVKNSTPVQVSGLSGVSAISAGGAHNLALKTDGTVWAWGDNTFGQLGDGSTAENSNTPVQVKNLSGVKAIAAGEDYSLALKTDGTVFSWGYNWAGQLGDGTTTQRNTPVAVKNLSGVSAIATGRAHSLALKSDGTVRSWGNNALGQLGDGSTTTRYTPVAVSGLSGVSDITAGRAHSLALKTDGTVWAWGDASRGQLGNNTSKNSWLPTMVRAPNGVALSGVSDITAGYMHSLALKTDGTVQAWGDNAKGQLGDGSTTTRYTPVAVSNLGNVKALAGGEFHSLAIVKEAREFTQ